ncbi:MAG: transcription elongation factor GreA [Acidobacteria bacterium]|nr:MAG: transcription elongation factor GreA [Acidobacteriota bacterium]REK01819.1 MAG: transcription elongation factor GreA [Acidobacteriota bacterium]REK14775.1 MAG: transcription elongation factor GreA [Acidobacteriota bacterium]REK45490.1 MAG: transcription elongation factor GreA [Acidobacteriota bacterium]
MELVREKLRQELAQLEDELHHKLPKEIQKAREFGDLRENAEYKAALERQSIVSARIGQLQTRISELESIDIEKLPEDRVAYGSKVVLYDLDRETEIEYRLVSSEESDPDKGRISTSSPIGQALMGKEEGDEIHVKTPKGTRNFEIAELVTIHELLEEEE